MPEPIRKTINLRGAARQILADRSPQVLVVGPAGTGKSFASLYKMHLMCLLNGACPADCEKEHEHALTGMRALMVRKTAKSLTSTGLVTFREQVAADAIAQGLLKWYGGSSERPAQYMYSNGSVIVVGGLDNPDKIMSAEYDLIFIQEATDATVEDWEKCTTRLRNGRVSFQQLLADCNPQQPSHWLKKRCDEGRTVMLHSRHEDNPTLFTEQGELTFKGENYMRTLDNLTGVRKERLRYGRWAAAEGMIYEDWTPANLSDRKQLPLDWPRYWGVDFGYTNPFVWQQWAVDPDGRLYLEREIYRTKRLVEDHAKDILDVVAPQGKWRYPRPVAILADHDAEDRATLERHLGIGTTAANKNVSEGIQAVQARIKVAGDGLPRLFVCRDSLVSVDVELREAGKPTRCAEEVEGYVWKPKPSGTIERPEPDEPLKLNDHSCLAAGAMVLTDRGEQPIEWMRAGDRVWTRKGWRAVLAAGVTQVSAPVLRVELSTGKALTGTGDHPVWVQDRGWVRLDALRYGDRLQAWEEPTPSDMAECCSAATPTPGTVAIGSTTSPASPIDRRGSSAFMRRSGWRRTARSRRATTSTTSTLTRSTITSPTCDACRRMSIRRSMLLSGRSQASIALRSVLRTWSGSGRSPRNGTPVNLAVRGTARTASVRGRGASIAPRTVSSAAASTARARFRALIASAPTLASQRGGVRPALMTWTGSVSSAARRSVSTSTPEPSRAPVSVLSVIELDRPVPVYNLTVQGAPEFVANGLLVHNCDTMRYVVAHLDLAPKMRIRFFNP